MKAQRVTTAKSVDGFKPRTARYVVRDDKVPGLELRVHPNGVKIWSLRYRNRAGDQRRLKLGVYDRMTLSQARDAANLELRKVDTGTDPQAERQAVREAAEQSKRDSIEALCSDYIERHAKPRKRTWRDDQSKINREILPRWRGRPVSSITRRDCVALVQAVADRGAPIYANRIAALLSKLFRFGIMREVFGIESNPATDLPKPGVEAMNRPEGERAEKAYDDDEIRAIWKATESLEPAVRAIYRIGLITGQRPREITGMQRAELAGEWWTLPARRTKNKREHRVYLSPLALDVLATVPHIVDEPYVFAGWRGKRQLAAVNEIVFAEMTTARMKPRHAMRDTVATGLGAAGVPTEHIAKVLNHAYGPRVTGGYNAHDYDREKRLALTKWSRRLTAILEAKPEQKVVSIGTRKGA